MNKRTADKMDAEPTDTKRHDVGAPADVFQDVLVADPVLPTTGDRGALGKIDTLYYSVDIEGSGPRKRDNWMLQLGVAAFVVRDGKVLLVSSFERKIAPPSSEHCFDEETSCTFWSLPDNKARLPDLLRLGEPVRKAMSEFVSWLDAFAAGRLCMLSDMPQYDAAWLDMYTELYTDVKRPLYVRRRDSSQPGNYKYEPAVCTDSVMRAVTKDFSCPWVSTLDACRACGASYYANPEPHDAAYDALAIGVNFFRVSARCGFKF